MDIPLSALKALSSGSSTGSDSRAESGGKRQLDLEASRSPLQTLGRTEHFPTEECLDASETPLIRVLAIEDTRSDAIVLENALSEVAGVRFEVTTAGRLSEATEVLATNGFDIVLTDLGLPDSSGLDTFLSIQQAVTELPIIVITGMSDERMGIRAVREGAQDYFVKGHYLENGLIRAIRDAIARQQMQAATRRDQERFRASIESLLDGFALLSPQRGPDGLISGFYVDYVNAAGLASCSQPAALPSQLTLEHLFPRCYRTGLFEGLLAVEKRGDSFKTENALLCYDHPNDLTAPCFDFRAVKTGGSIAISWRDVSPRLRLEAQVLQSQKMNSVGQLAAGIAHDFNNLLTVIHGHTDGMIGSALLAPAMVAPLHEISAAALRATKLTQQLLSFSRQQPLIAVDVDINDTVAQMTNMLGRILGETVRLRVEFRQPTPHVRADRGMIEQILVNLAVNSRDSMPDGGELVITTALCTVAENELVSEHDVAPGLFVCLIVRDTSCGIAVDHLQQIFEPFFTTKDIGKGTGLGLATVYGIVKQHKGWIKVESEVGRGTAFKVYLPHYEVAPVLTPPIEMVEPPAHGNETVLLVEDEETIRELAMAFLEEHGYHVIEARNGVEALGLWEENREKIDLLLTDLVMPHGVSGRQLADQLKADRPGLRVIYTSGYSCDLFRENSIFDPATNFLPKPYRLNRMAEMVRHSLDQVRTAAGV